jgi:hydrogenase-1 operon protein HyaE
MSANPLLESLLALDGVRELGAKEIDAFLDAAPGAALLLIRGEGARRPETADALVAVRELKRAFGARIAVAVASARDEHSIKQRVGAVIVPSVVLLRGREVVKTLPRVQDWAEYRAAVLELVGEERAA